jgi:hypothetical protein
MNGSRVDDTGRLDQRLRTGGMKLLLNEGNRLLELHTLEESTTVDCLG